MARRQATVSSEVTGKIAEVLVEEGMRVSEGQVLARLDPSSGQVRYVIPAREAALSYADALRRAARLHDEVARAEALSALAPYLPATLQGQALALAGDLPTILAAETQRVANLSRFAEVLATPDLLEALQAGNLKRLLLALLLPAAAVLLLMWWYSADLALTLVVLLGLAAAQDQGVTPHRELQSVRDVLLPGTVGRGAGLGELHQMRVPASAHTIPRECIWMIARTVNGTW